jgi:hypothetical protein
VLRVVWRAAAVSGARTRAGFSATAADLVSFAFGLLHGQGFASVLIDAGLPLAGLLVALLAFNVGVELGQALWASLSWLGLRALPAKLAPRVVGLCALGLALLGLYWTWERTHS